MKSLSRVQLFVTPRTVACQALLSKEFSRQEYWSGLPFPSPGESSLSRDQTWISCIADRFFTTQGLRAPYFSWQHGLSSTFRKLNFLRDSMSGSLIILTPKCLRLYSLQNTTLAILCTAILSPSQETSLTGLH